MNSTPGNAVPKIHPTQREWLPDDPMQMHAVEVDGDADLMLRLLVEEYARIGWGADRILALASDPNYLAFYGLRRRFGAEELRRRVQEIVSHCGVAQVRVVECPAVPDLLVPLQVPADRHPRG